jgi:hypothetical protein
MADMAFFRVIYRTKITPGDRKQPAKMVVSASAAGIAGSPAAADILRPHMVAAPVASTTFSSAGGTGD